MNYAKPRVELGEVLRVPGFGGQIALRTVDLHGRHLT
jgi:hypothetical protein